MKIAPIALTIALLGSAVALPAQAQYGTIGQDQSVGQSAPLSAAKDPAAATGWGYGPGLDAGTTSGATADTKRHGAEPGYRLHGRFGVIYDGHNVNEVPNWK